MANHYNLKYEFGPFMLDLNKRVLTREGEMIPLAPKATELLIILVLNASELIEKDDLLKEVWPNTFVEEANLTQNIFTLRKVLGDERADPKYIETVARRGYRFIAPVRTMRVDENDAGDLELTEATASSQPVVAVLPFLNATGDQEFEYLAAGLTDNIINHLSRISGLRVMARSVVFRYLRKEGDAQKSGRELGVNAVLVGKISSAPTGVSIVVELVSVSTGWQLWGASFDAPNKNLLEIQNNITHGILAALKLSVSGDEERRVTTRYTENPNAYQSYLKGRYHSSPYTRNGIEKAIGYFRCAIELDPNYALAYAGIIDCYLRLITNYIPPPNDEVVKAEPRRPYAVNERPDEADSKIKLRFEWDWKGAERELRRANELKTTYPSAHQWYGAYRAIKELYEQSSLSSHNKSLAKMMDLSSSEALPLQIGSIKLTSSEQVQVYCTICREQIDTGNYDAACSVLRPWWLFGNWPKLEELDQPSCADLLFTAGELAGCVASTRQLASGQKHAEELLNGSIALFEQLGLKRRAAEGRIELAFCYYRQGLFDVGRATLCGVLDKLCEDNWELRSLALIRMGCLERHAGRLKDALARLHEAISIVEVVGPWATGRCYLELASTYSDLAKSEELEEYFSTAREFYLRALYEFEAVGNHRLVAIALNNLGYLMVSLGNYFDAESYLRRARRNFDCFNDKIRSAQVDDSLARLYLAQRKLEEAAITIEGAVQIMENGDEDVLLAEALTTKGLIYCRTKRHSEARRAFADAHRLASRCGDSEGAGRALLVWIEEMYELLEANEQELICGQLVELLSASQQPSIHRRLQRCLDLIAHDTARPLRGL